VTPDKEQIQSPVR